MRLLEHFDRLRSGFKIAALGVLLLGIVIVDVAVGSDLTLRAAYLLPIGVAAWTIGRGTGYSFAAVAVAICLYFDVKAGLGRNHPRFVYSDAIVRLIIYGGAVITLRRLREAQSRLDDLAQFDPLTGLYNRRGFGELAAHEISRARRTRNPITIAHFDLDGFKQVNDTLGHAVGDAVLAAVSVVLRSGRTIDVAARMGGDEFALLLPDTNVEAAKHAIGRLRKDLELAMRERNWDVTTSVGVATFIEVPASLDAMLAVADRLLYEIKRAGKNGSRFGEFNADAAPYLAMNSIGAEPSSDSASAPE